MTRVFPRVWQAVVSRPILIAAIACGILAWLLLPPLGAGRTRLLLAWDVGCAVMLALCAVLFSHQRLNDVAANARRQEEGEWTIFALVLGTVAVSFAAVLGEFGAAKASGPEMRGLHMGMVGLTLLLSWLVTHTLFCLRYAHEFYTGSDDPNVPDGGLEFPGTRQPDYWDFMYFSLVLGMTFQVSDVQITARKLRRLAVVHGLLSFLFNTVIVALSVNIGASFL